MPDDDSVEVSGKERCHRRAECRAISNAKPEESAEPRIPLDASEVAVEEMIPALFVRREIEEEIRDDQRATRYMQEEMFLEAWDTSDGEDLKVPRPFGGGGQQRLGGKIHDLVEAVGCKEWDIGKSIPPLSSVGVVEQHRFHKPRRLAQGPDLGQVSRREWGHRMKDEAAGRHANDRQRSAEIGAEQGKRIMFNPQVLGELFHAGRAL